MKALSSSASRRYTPVLSRHSTRHRAARASRSGSAVPRPVERVVVMLDAPHRQAVEVGLTYSPAPRLPYGPTLAAAAASWCAAVSGELVRAEIGARRLRCAL